MFAVIAVLVVVYVSHNSFFNKNSIMTANVKDPSITTAKVSTQSITDDTSTAAAILAGTKTIHWQTVNYPAQTGVNINLIKRVSDSPREFVLVRTLAIDVANSGQYSWAPLGGEVSNDLYVQVTCSTTHSFSEGCNLATEPIKVY